MKDASKTMIAWLSPTYVPSEFAWLVLLGPGMSRPGYETQQWSIGLLKETIYLIYIQIPATKQPSTQQTSHPPIWIQGRLNPHHTRKHVGIRLSREKLHKNTHIKTDCSWFSWSTFRFSNTHPATTFPLINLSNHNITFKTQLEIWLK
jgi:hypothetical protein